MNLGTEGGAPTVVSGATAPQSEPGSAAATNRSLDTLERVLGEIGGAARMTEGTFVGIGQRLEASINTIDGLTTTFKTLMEELGGDELVRATADLSQVSTRIGALAHAPRDSEAVLG